MAMSHEKKDYVCDLISSCEFSGKEFVKKKVPSLKKEGRLVMYRNKDFKNRKRRDRDLLHIFDRNFQRRQSNLKVGRSARGRGWNILGYI